jgi:RNA polymerase II elongation factor ELL
MTLKIPDGGLLLGAPSGKDNRVPQQAFAITLSDNVIESMINCVQNGGDIQLALGNSPTLLYGSQSHRISPPADSFPHDLYLTQPYESTREAMRIPHTSSIFVKPKKLAPLPGLAARNGTDDLASSKPKPVSSSKSSTSSGMDSDLETLQNGLAAHDKSRERTRISKPPTTKKGSAAAKGKLLPGYTSTGRSLPTSPALNAARSPETHAFSASQQVVERKKEQRSILVHELAVKDRSLEYLQSKWRGKDDELQPTLEKVADYVAETEKWAMKKTFWKELDVWNYKYKSQEERQTAIDNAVNKYDKQRMSAREPEWQKLLPIDERGKGKCLSVLQASLAKKNTTEALAVEAQTGAEPMARSSSNPLPNKAKKPSAQEAQAKRLLGKSKPATQTPAQKTSPTKTKTAGPKASAGRILSQEFVENSDSSGDEAPPAQAQAQVKPRPAPRPAPKAVAPPTQETVVVKQRPVIKEPVRQQQAVKRPREDDESSSSSGTPLSKRIKDKQILHPPSGLKRRPNEPAQNSRGTHSGTTLKNKATSPTKSSPLASSPPTNASDLENETARQVMKKRKADMDSRPVPAKRAQVSSDVLREAHRFKMYYQKYEALHYEISALDNPPVQKIADLKDMRDRLQDMKTEIYRQYQSDRD